MRASVNVDAQMKPGKRARFATCALALVLGASLVSFLAPADAYADVRKSDLIAGKSVEERGVAAIKCPSIDAEFAMLVDSDGFVYFERNADVSAQIASVTKVMTASWSRCLLRLRPSASRARIFKRVTRCRSRPRSRR